MKLSDLKPSDIASVQPPPSSTKKGGMRLSDLDPSEIVDVAIPEEKGLLSKTLEGLDRYGAAPLRAAYGKAQDSMLKKGAPLDVVGAAKAAYDQFGDDPEKAPTAAQLVEQNPLGSVLNKQGFKESFATHPTAVGLRGLMAPFTGWDRSGEIVGEVPRVAAETLVAGETDPISYIPGAVIERPLVAAGKQVAKVAPGLVNRSAGAAEFFTGVPKESWKNYITRNKQVKDLEKTFGPQVQDAADTMREGWNQAIKDRKAQLGLEIEQAVLNAPRKPNIPAEPILLELNNAKMGLNPNIPEHLSAIKEIDNHMNVVKSLAPEGKLTARDAFDLQKTLQGRGRSAYSVNGAIFNPAPQSAKAARDAARVTRQFVNKAMPGVAKANEAFTALHDIDDLVRTSLVTPGKSNAGLMGAVGKTQNQDTVALRELGDWLNKDLLTETRDFATYKHMQGLGADASDKTGKAVYRAMMGGLVGAGGGYASTDDAKIGLIAGGLAGSLGTNPKLWRAALDAGIGTKAAISSLAGKGGLLEKGAEKINPTMRALEKRLEGAGGKAKEFIKDEEGAFSPDDLFKILKSPPKPNKGVARVERINELRKLQAIYQKQGDLEKLSEIESQINNLMSADVFDLKKARELVGEPKRGLLEPKDNPVGAFPKMRKDGEYIWDGGELKKSVPKLSQTDHVVLSDLSEKVKRGEKLTDKDRQFLKAFQDKADSTDLWQQANEVHLKDRFQQQEIENMPYFRREVETRGNLLPSDHARLKTLLSVVKDNNPKLAEEIRTLLSADVKKSFNQPDKTKGLLTSLDVERGPVKELPEAGDAIPFNDDARMKLDRQRSSAQSGQFKPGQLIADEDGRNFKILDVNPKTGMIMLETPDGGRSFEYADTLAEYLNDVKNAPALMNETKGAIDVATAAEAERLKKGLIGVDFGGRGGKVPKEKAPSFPKDSKFQKNQEVTYGGRPAKVVQYDGNGVYTVKVGNSHQQVHMSELKSGKGKPKKKK